MHVLSDGIVGRRRELASLPALADGAAVVWGRCVESEGALAAASRVRPLTPARVMAGMVAARGRCTQRRP